MKALDIMSDLTYWMYWQVAGATQADDNDFREKLLKFPFAELRHYYSGH
jgi:hypothetical protein